MAAGILLSVSATVRARAAPGVDLHQQTAADCPIGHARLSMLRERRNHQTVAATLAPIDKAAIGVQGDGRVLRVHGQGNGRRWAP